MLQNPKKAWASDANFTLRLTYGRVLPYSPADGIEYNYYTTLKGVMEKENPQNPTEFTVPENSRSFMRHAISAVMPMPGASFRWRSLPTAILRAAIRVHR